MEATLKQTYIGTSLVVQWLRFCASEAGGIGSIPDQGTKIPHAGRCGHNIFFLKTYISVEIKGILYHLSPRLFTVTETMNAIFHMQIKRYQVPAWFSSSSFISCFIWAEVSVSAKGKVYVSLKIMGKIRGLS